MHTMRIMRQGPLFAVSLLLSAGVCQAAGMTFHPTLEAARKAASGEKPVILYFTATWCGWCRRLEASVFPEDEATEVAKRFEWVKIDIDEHRDIAARYRVRGAPVFIVLGTDDVVRGSHSGFLPVDKFVEFLDASLKAPEKPLLEIADRPEPLPEGVELIRALRDPSPDLVRAAVLQLARADRGQRSRVLNAFAVSGNGPLPALVEMMESETLSVRAAAAAALDHSTQAGLPFHPFAPAPRRDQQVMAWTAWLQAKGVVVPTKPAEAEIPKPSPVSEEPEIELKKTSRPSESAADAEIP